jgi:6-pyruvoyltetrahydropterin/6-carboxytetrahydropterin synthase
MIITKRFSFEASHILPRHEGKCSRLHGHSWSLSISVEGPICAETGFVVDYAKLSRMVERNLIEHLDHSHLGHGLAQCVAKDRYTTFQPYFGTEFYPSSENLCRAIFKLLAPLVKELSKDVRLYQVEIDETCTSSACWSRLDEYTNE